MSLFRRGGKERGPMPSGQEPTGIKPPDFGAPKVEDPYRSTVDYYIRDSSELPQVQLDLQQKFKDPTVVDQLMARVTTGREERAKKDQG